ncbi:uncharacterized protein BDR25DRAFT_307059 [Lindgomyces ingoldianus]|uniref:Uncharacterized protein n=1 Tax=Lindgomyces ingoldianus TaxID=673940 RepID=A0ACB6QDZ8_9PLEO|nr:uncharacterized protein BDR25DRAFT_307059 [Lindgomyces ingoldianus]KAF2464725.1 hypothetical protein BDR25DRAFT_307059 [Lindgomyces ingoldianus]
MEVSPGTTCLTQRDSRPSGAKSTVSTSSTNNQWPLCVQHYTSCLVSQDAAIRDTSQFENTYLSKQTSVEALSQGKGNVVEELLCQDHHSADLQRVIENNSCTSLFIHRFVMKPGTQGAPKDLKRLRLSGSAFRWLLSRFDVSPSFVSALLNPDLPSGYCDLTFTDSAEHPVHIIWYIITVRSAVNCVENETSHVLSAAGSNQMDSASYLHLEDLSSDIRPSRIAVYSRHDGQSSNAICIDFQDGRWHHLVEEPYNRVKEVLTLAQTRGHTAHPATIHVAMLSSSARWWKQALAQLKSQLISYEKRLLVETTETAAADRALLRRQLEMNKALHTIISHLRRYKIELETSMAIAKGLLESDHLWRNDHNSNSLGQKNPGDSTRNALALLSEQFHGFRAVAQELESKTETILALVFQFVKWTNDMLLVSNGKSMFKLMKSSREQGKFARRMLIESHNIAKDTRKDSVSMKTLALLTMFFLPATSFASILAMPFFNQQDWLHRPTTAWLWVVLTVLTTSIAVAIYIFFTHRSLRSQNCDARSDEEDELDSVDLDNGD